MSESISSSKEIEATYCEKCGELCTGNAKKGACACSYLTIGDTCRCGGCRTAAEISQRYA